VQWIKGLTKNGLKIEISIKVLAYSVKFAVLKIKAKQIHGFYRNVILLPRLHLEKILAHCDG